MKQDSFKEFVLDQLAGLRPEEISLEHEGAIKKFISPTKVLKLPAEVLRVPPDILENGDDLILWARQAAQNATGRK